MRIIHLVALTALSLCIVAGAASADLVTVGDPHPDGNGTGNTCEDVFALDGSQHLGVCAGTYVPCPLYVVLDGFSAC
jgi:hypothetical protein